MNHASKLFATVAAISTLVLGAAYHNRSIKQARAEATESARTLITINSTTPSEAVAWVMDNPKMFKNARLNIENGIYVSNKLAVVTPEGVRNLSWPNMERGVTYYVTPGDYSSF